MSFLNHKELEKIGFKKLGTGVLLSDKAVIYNPELIELGDNCRIDDFTILSGVVKVGRFVHIASHCNIGGGSAGIVFEDFSNVGVGGIFFARSDDYSGITLSGPNIPAKYKNLTDAPILVGKHSLFGSGCKVQCGVTIGEGCSFGTGAIVTKSTEPWGIYVGIPAKYLKPRSKDLLELEKEFLKDFYLANS